MRAARSPQLHIPGLQTERVHTVGAGCAAVFISRLRWDWVLGKQDAAGAGPGPAGGFQGPQSREPGPAGPGASEGRAEGRELRLPHRTPGDPISLPLGAGLSRCVSGLGLVQGSQPGQALLTAPGLGSAGASGWKAEVSECRGGARAWGGHSVVRGGGTYPRGKSAGAAGGRWPHPSPGTRR